MSEDGLSCLISSLPLTKGIKMVTQTRNLIQRMLLILALGVSLGLLNNTTGPDKLEIVPGWSSKTYVPRINIQQARTKHLKGVLFIDARPNSQYRLRHISGAINIPADLFDFAYKMRFTNPRYQDEIIVYGRTFSRVHDEKVCKQLSSIGHKNIKILSAGLSAWQAQGYPTEP